MDLNFSGLIVGLVTFIVIGLFHPIVIKAEYHFGKGCWWAFLVAGIIFAGVSVFLSDLVYSTVAGVVSFSCFWSILELFEQEKRVKKGWFPSNPRRYSGGSRRS